MTVSVNGMGADAPRNWMKLVLGMLLRLVESLT